MLVCVIKKLLAQGLQEHGLFTHEHEAVIISQPLPCALAWNRDSSLIRSRGLLKFDYFVSVPAYHSFISKDEMKECCHIASDISTNSMHSIQKDVILDQQRKECWIRQITAACVEIFSYHYFLHVVWKTATYTIVHNYWEVDKEEVVPHFASVAYLPYRY